MSPRPDVSTSHGASPQRLFLDPKVGIAEGAAQWLLDDASADGVADLRRTLVVVPGSRAGRLLLRTLVVSAAARGLALEAPVIATVGRLFDAALEPEAEPAAVANPLERRLAWEHALAAAEGSLVAPFIARGQEPDRTLWRRLAATAVRLEDDLDAAERSFEDAAEAVRRMQGDAGRISALAAIEPEARRMLGERSLRTPREARSRLIESGRFAFDAIALVGTLELGAPQRRLLARAPRVVALIAAEERHAARFDAYGTASAAWGEALITLPEEIIETAERPRDVAECGMRAIADWADETPDLAVDQCAIGLADDSLADALRLAGADAGVDVHVAAGVPLLASPVGRALRAIGAYRASRAPADAAALLRVPTIGGFLAREVLAAMIAEGEREPDAHEPDLLAAMDRIRSERLPASLDQPLGPGDGVVVQRTIERFDRWMPPQRQGDADATGGAAAIVEGLAALDWSERDAAVIQRLRTLAADIDGIDASLRGAADPLELLLDECRSLHVPGEPRERAIEAIGWLELLFEPAPHVVVLGMNEGAVPSGAANDPLLPESVRESLGMATRASRAARDAALLDALVRRVPKLRIVVGRRSAEGDPLLPSRLLLRDRGAALARRVARLTDHTRALSGERSWRAAVAGTSGFVVPTPPESACLIDAMGATAFRAYLASGMRFWLDRIERLEGADDDPTEIALPDLGTLVHATLAALTEDGLDAITDAETLRKTLLPRFDRAARERFGSRPLPAVRLQLDVMRQRLDRFATWQAANAAEGWRVHAAERPLPDGFAIAPPGVAPMRIRGRVDRIDRHLRTGAWRIIDYKTSDAGKTPRASHRAGKKGTGDWTDLQLPLYLHGLRDELASIAGGATAIEIGYVRLPADPALAGWCAADFSADEIDDALGLAATIVGAIRRGEFPMGESLGPDDPFEGILQTTVFGRDDRDDEGDGGPSGGGE